MANCPKQPFFTPVITLYDYLTGSGPFDFPYMNPKSTPQCKVTGFGFGNATGLNCTHFENPFNELRYAGKLVTWMFTSKSENYVIQNILKSIFPWDEGPKGPSASNLTCFFINIGSLFSLIALMLIALVFIYVVISQINSCRRAYKDYVVKSHLEHLQKQSEQQQKRIDELEKMVKKDV